MVKATMRVLAKPASEAGGADPYPQLLYTPMRNLGVRVDEFTTWRALRGQYDIFHLHWPEYYIAHRNSLKAYVGSIMLLFLIFWCRFRGAKVIWTVHNLTSHNKPRPRVEEMFWNLFTRGLHGYITLNRSGRSMIPRRFPAMKRLPHAVIPSIYSGVYRSTTDRLEARSRLGISPEGTVYLFFGTVARYKGIPQLIDAFRNLEDPGAVLCVAGAVAHKEIEPLLRDESRRDPRIHLHLSRIPDEELGIYFTAGDVAVLPYSEIFNSGCALVSLALCRPVLVPAIGAMPELQELAGSEWVRLYSGTLTTEHLEQAMDWALHGDRSGRSPLEQFDWNTLAAETVRFYQTLLTPRLGESSASLASRPD
jgi:beta-1,4-mannosyltransferase